MPCELWGAYTTAWKHSERGGVVLRRLLYVAQNVRAGGILTAAHARSIRPGYGPCAQASARRSGPANDLVTSCGVNGLVGARSNDKRVGRVRCRSGLHTDLRALRVAHRNGLIQHTC